MMFHSTLFALLVAIGTTLAAPAFAAHVKVAIVSRTVFFMPLWVADQKGFPKQEGIDVTIEVVNNAEKINEQVQAGIAQVAISTSEALLIDAQKGGRFRMVASVAQKPPHFIVAKPSIKTLADLRGARFGVLSLHEGTTFLVDDLAKAAGLAKGDYSVEAVGGAPTRWKLLQEGKIDAGLQPFPLSYQSDAAGFTNLGPIAAYVPDYEFTVVFADEKWATANRATLTGFLRAMVKAQAYMRSHPAETAEIAMKELHASTPDAERALADNERLHITPDGLRVSDKGLARVHETLLRAGLIAVGQTFDRTKYVDESYLAAAK
jgi:ABC-type nitrate/sulfonate/bicarbonate transport system substrate-binding protein